jgi:hypothetical protein
MFDAEIPYLSDGSSEVVQGRWFVPPAMCTRVNGSRSQPDGACQLVAS